MARINLGSTVQYIIVSLLVAIFVAIMSWGFWVMAIMWNLNGGQYQIPIIATSAFWFAVGVLSWAILYRRKL